MAALGNPILVDSSYYITLLRARTDPLERLTTGDSTFEYGIAVCGVVWMEVLRGRSEPAWRDRFNRFFQTSIFLNLTPAAWERVAQLTWELDRKGEVLPATDLMIAACAIEHDVPVLTFDRHFQKIPGVVALDYLP
jgi:predicted nucleic acid-binding protein